VIKVCYNVDNMVWPYDDIDYGLIKENYIRTSDYTWTTAFVIHEVRHPYLSTFSDISEVYYAAILWHKIIFCDILVSIK
jgi:hypothetical protein